MFNTFIAQVKTPDNFNRLITYNLFADNVAALSSKMLPSDTIITQVNIVVDKHEINYQFEPFIFVAFM